MDYIADSAALVAAITGVGAWIRWTARWVCGRREQRHQEQAAIENRNWHGYIEPAGINTWFVRLLERPNEPTARVILEVVDSEGAPDAQWANNLRQKIEEDGILARAPSPAERDFLIALKKERGYGRGGHLIQ